MQQQHIKKIIFSYAVVFFLLMIFNQGGFAMTYGHGDSCMYYLITKKTDGTVIKREVLVSSNIKHEILLDTIPALYFPVSFNDTSILLFPRGFNPSDSCLRSYNLHTKVINKRLCLSSLREKTRYGHINPYGIMCHENKIYYKSFHVFQGYGGEFFHYLYNQDTYSFTMCKPEFINENSLITYSIGELGYINKHFVCYNFHNKEIMYLYGYSDLILIKNTDSLFAVRYKEDELIYELGVIELDYQFRGFDIGEITREDVASIDAIKSICINLQTKNKLDFELLYCDKDALYYRLLNNGISDGIYKLSIKINIIEKISNSGFDYVLIDSKAKRLLGINLSDNQKSYLLYGINLD